VPNYYLDIETTGLDEVRNEILTIQWCELERNTGRALEDLHILKSWESSEKTILQEFSNAVDLTNPYDFTFVPIGYNLGFEHKFLSYRSEKHDTFPISIMARPHIDLHQLAIMMNRGEFKGTKLSNLTNKTSDGSIILQYIANKDYDKIEEYIRMETKEFIKFTQWAFSTVPILMPELQQAFPKPFGK